MKQSETMDENNKNTFGGIDSYFHSVSCSGLGKLLLPLAAVLHRALVRSWCKFKVVWINARYMDTCPDRYINLSQTSIEYIHIAWFDLRLQLQYEPNVHNTSA